MTTHHPCKKRIKKPPMECLNFTKMTSSQEISNRADISPFSASKMLVLKNNIYLFCLKRTRSDLLKEISPEHHSLHLGICLLPASKVQRPKGLLPHREPGHTFSPTTGTLLRCQRWILFKRPLLEWLISKNVVLTTSLRLYSTTGK